MTLNQTITRLRLLALTHSQINSFIDEESEDEDIAYPAIFCFKQPGTIDRANRLTLLNFKLLFLDKENVIEDTASNRLEVQSDMLSVAMDYKSLAESVEHQEDWTVSFSSAFDWLSDFGTDVCAGVSMDIAVGISYVSNRCQVPEKTDVYPENLLKTDQGDFLKIDGNYYLKVS